MTEHVAVRCKPTTQRACRHILDKFLLPRFGGLRLSEVTPDHVAALHYRLHDKPTMANQVVSLLSRLFYTAAKSGEAPAGGNPCRFIEKYPTRSRERFLSEQEFDRLGRVLADLETRGTISTSAAAALRLLMLTGCRRNEVVTLRWEHVDLEHDELRLRDAKTGARAVPLSSAAIQVLSSSPRRPDNPWVFPGRVRGTRLRTLNASWQVVRKEAGLEDVRLHDLRHSFASRALALGESLSMIGKLLGHNQVQTTARYAHLARNSVKVAAATIADSLGHRYGHTAGRFSRPMIYTTPVRFGADSRSQPPAGGSRVGGGGCPRWRNGDYRKQRVRRSVCAGIGGGGAARYWAAVRQLTGWFAGMAAHGRVLAEPARLRRRGTGDCGEGTEFIERGHAPLPPPATVAARAGMNKSDKLYRQVHFGPFSLQPNTPSTVRLQVPSAVRIVHIHSPTSGTVQQV